MVMTTTTMMNAYDDPSVVAVAQSRGRSQQVAYVVVEHQRLAGCARTAEPHVAGRLEARRHVLEQAELADRQLTARSTVELRQFQTHGALHRHSLICRIARLLPSQIRYS